LEAGAPTVTLVDPSLTQTRRRIADLARGRVGDAALDDLDFALSEAVINAQLYGRPPTSVRIWANEERLVIHVHDTGPGPADPLTGLIPAPDRSSGAGLGLWLSHQLAAIDIALIRDAAGFTVRLRGGRLPDVEERAGQGVLGAGTLGGGVPSRGTVHAIDGDRSSFCDRIGSAELVRLDGLLWADVPPDQRCPECRFLMDVYGNG